MMESELKFKKLVTKWVEKVLENRNFNKIRVEFPGYDTKGGYAGEITFIDVHTEKCGKSEKHEMIVKRNKEGDVALELLDLQLVYENEVNLYAKLVPFFENFAKQKNTKIFDDIPYCYGTINEKGRHVIIMENLKSKGYKVHDIKQAIDLRHAKLVLAAYGKWHAFSFAIRDQKCDKILEEFKGVEKKFFDSKISTYFLKTIENEFNYIIDMYEKKNLLKMIPKLKTLKENYSSLYTEMQAPKNDEFLVMRHGDCWNNNFLFHYKGDGQTPDKVAIIDWQIAFFGPPLADVTQFLFYGCSRKELEHLDELLRFYYEELSRKLRELGSDPAKCFPWNVCVETFRKYAPLGISGCSMIAKMGYRVETGDRYELTNVLEDGDFSKILGELEDPEGYFQRVNDVLELSVERNLI